MTAPSWLTWLMVGGALLLLPPADPVRERVRMLALRGRLEAIERSRVRRRELPPVGNLSPLVVGIAAGLPVVAGAGAPLGLAVAVAAATSWQLVRDGLRRRSDRRAATALLSAVRVVVAELSAGSRPAAALDAAAATDPHHAETFAAAAERARSGTDADEVLASASQLVSFAHAWRLGAVAGVPMADVIGRVAGDLASRAKQGRTVSSALATVRSSAALLAVLPVLGVALGSAMDAEPLGFLFGNPAGRWVLLAGVVLDAAGLLWTQRLAVRAERA